MCFEGGPKALQRGNYLLGVVGRGSNEHIQIVGRSSVPVHGNCPTAHDQELYAVSNKLAQKILVVEGEVEFSHGATRKPAPATAREGSTPQPSPPPSKHVR